MCVAALVCGCVGFHSVAMSASVEIRLGFAYSDFLLTVRGRFMGPLFYPVVDRLVDFGLDCGYSLCR